MPWEGEILIHANTSLPEGDAGCQEAAGFAAFLCRDCDLLTVSDCTYFIGDYVGWRGGLDQLGVAEEVGDYLSSFCWYLEFKAQPLYHTSRLDTYLEVFRQQRQDHTQAELQHSDLGNPVPRNTISPFHGRIRREDAAGAGYLSPAPLSSAGSRSDEVPSLLPSPSQTRTSSLIEAEDSLLSSVLLNHALQSLLLPDVE